MSLDTALTIYIWVWPIVLASIALLLIGCWLETRKGPTPPPAPPAPPVGRDPIAHHPMNCKCYGHR